MEHYNSKAKIKKEVKGEASNVSDDETLKRVNQFKVDIKDIPKLPKNEIQNKFDD